MKNGSLKNYSIQVFSIKTINITNMGKRFNNLKNILVVRLGAMGDIVHVMPAAKNLRMAFPSAHIAWLVEDKLEDLVEGLQGIDEVIVFPRRQWQKHLKSPRNYCNILSSMRLFLKKLRNRKYDIALDFHGNFKSGLLTYLSGARTRVGFSKGYCKEFNFLFTNLWIAPQQKRMHRIDKYLGLLHGLGIKAYYQRPVFSIPDTDRLYIDDFLCQNHLDQKSIAIIHPGTSMFGKYKRWPPENYAHLADILTKEFNYSIVFTWGASEYNLIEKILSLMRYQATIACETSSVKQLIALLQHAHLFVGGDTGPTHIASSIGIPTVAIFGPKDPVIYAPYDRNALVVRKDIPCSPCEKRKCDHVTCINIITPGDVFKAVKDIGKLK
ncbi:MAG: putative heptosyltransferase [Candidatus Brocadia sinica]|nr:MAG: putative heptosyltransferase [Candidatus Brocadia sinica]MCK6469229.1 glycosyltransferase family 9 protein [Candidatus Brocadia sinica]NUO05971.1 glycosyltransferase family 9 protein [Candidatus Brocadia sinica]